MELTISTLNKTITKLGYKWFSDRPNIIGIRTSLQVPDVFNDFLCVVFKQPEIPANYSVLNKQKWLNKWGYKGKDGKPLTEDGKVGSNTNFALAQLNNDKNKERLKIYVITTDPGLYYQTVKILNAKGCAIIKPGHYLNCYQLGKHIRPDHKALIQTGGKITVYRDNDRDGIAENLGVEETGFFGCNIHGAKKLTKTDKIGAYSAGCQVFEDWFQKEEFITLCEQFKETTGNKFTYTLIEEKNLL
ncbi:MAG: hypothetical protein H0W84_09755 [Bacteroidetes bacterium]|nr:hypothetical protein [Bacteroidota bacterium]